jgi:hypothetical protein
VKTNLQGRLTAIFLSAIFLLETWPTGKWRTGTYLPDTAQNFDAQPSASEERLE